jgi:hypothetical protein
MASSHDGEQKEVIIVRKYAKWPFVLMAFFALVAGYFLYRGVVLM